MTGHAEPRGAGHPKGEPALMQTSIQPSTPRSFPGSLKVIVAIYILTGSIAVMIGVISAFQGSLYVNSTALSLAVGIGLLLRKKPWRIIGIVLNLLVLAGCAVFGFLILSSWAAYRQLWQNVATLIGQHWSPVLLYGTIALSIMVIAFCVWSTYLLTRSRIRLLFPSTKSPTSGYFAALLVVFVVVTLARETGGLNLNLSTTQFSTSTFSFDGRPSLPNLRVVPPVIIEINGLGSESIVVITELNVNQTETPFGKETKRSWNFERYTGWLASRAKERYQDRAQYVRIDVSHVDLKGAYWLPLEKSGSASFEATIRGTGELSTYDSSIRGQIDFSVYGFCSVHNLRQRLQQQVAGMALNKFINSAGVR